MSSLDFETSSCRNINNNNTHGYASNNNNNISNSSLMQKPIPAPSSNAPAQLIQVSCSHVLESEPSASNAAKIPDTAALLALDSSEDSEYEPFISSNAPIRRGTRSSSSSSVLRSLKRNSCWGRIHGFLTRNWYLSCLVPASILGALIFIGWATRDYARQLLFWIEMQNAWIIFAVYMALFALVSFPVVVGYFVLLITAGYLFGCLRGWLIVILGANLGIAVAHATIRSCRHRIPVQRIKGGKSIRQPFSSRFKSFQISKYSSSMYTQISMIVTEHIFPISYILYLYHTSHSLKSLIFVNFFADRIYPKVAILSKIFLIKLISKMPLHVFFNNIIKKQFMEKRFLDLSEKLKYSLK
ncbi:uncharacterized protein LOC108116777 isoform X2 [Drosophila eugracilis]|uniref:uncharacterized protein LOC108116777 isoform X2 n=1 Tax=Drosophila eugracilis TaxID=29029 RepID=UPI001BD9E74E|nr:uncharacterized protein LOC108116777 isoform X2 [Drosophila eugracilis]